MSRAEDLAKKYCEGSSFEDACMEKPAYIAGYHQAEKDLALTWDDIKMVIEIADKLICNNVNEIIDNGIEWYYKEVLKRFKDLKHVK